MSRTRPSYRNAEDSSKTLVPVAKDTILAAIPGIRESVKQTREKERQREIEKAAKEQRVPVKTPWYRFDTSRTMTREEAEAWVDSSPTDSDGFREVYWPLTGQYWENLADHLERAALIVEDGEKLLLDLESANLVAEYQPEVES